MKITRTIKQERDCIQYTGNNIEEVLMFINAHGANANEITLTELTTKWKRPAELPLDFSGIYNNHDWHRDEEYQIYLNLKENKHCYLAGICKNDWLVEDRNGYLEVYTDTAFNSILKYGNWTKEEE